MKVPLPILLALSVGVFSGCTSVTVRKMGGCGVGGKNKEEQLAYWGGEGDKIKTWYWSNEKQKAHAPHDTGSHPKRIILTLPERVEDGALKVPEQVELMR